MTPTRRAAVATGVLFFATHVTSVTALALYGPALDDAGFVTGSGSEQSVLTGAFLEVLLALTIVGTGVAIFPLVRRYSEGAALGYAALRTLEAAVIAVGIVPLLALTTLREDGVASASDAVAPALVSLHDWTFLLGPSFVCATNTTVLAFALLRSGLVARFVPVIGLVGGPLLFASGTAQLFGAVAPLSAVAAVCAVPVFAWEISLATYLLVKGFRPDALRRLDAREAQGQPELVAA